MTNKHQLARNLRIGTPLILLMVLLFWLWEGLLEDRLIPKGWGIVVGERFFRSGQLHPALVEETLRENNIDVVVDLTREKPDDPDQIAERKAIQDLGLDSHRFPLRGNGTGNPEMYAEALLTVLASLDDNKRVLIHCSAGSQRTGALTAYYRMLVEKWDPATTLAEMSSYGMDPEDDQALVAYINDNMALIAKRLLEKGAVSDLPTPLPRLGE